MELRDIRSALLEEHASIRAIVGEVIEAATAWREGDGPRAYLHMALGRLSVAIVEHNAHEEQLLRRIIEGIDAWGPARAQIMLDEHVREHRELGVTVQVADACDDPRVAWEAVSRLADQMRAHMEREEKTFLGADLLSDDPVKAGDYFGG